MYSRDMGTLWRVPNWAVALALGCAAAGTYYYTLYAVGTSDIEAEVQKELKAMGNASGTAGGKGSKTE
jgi:hypothetical protein